MVTRYRHATVSDAPTTEPTGDAGPAADQATDDDDDGWASDVDCNDKDAAVNPDAYEVCGDSADNDCDGAVDGADPDCGSTGSIGGSAGAGGSTGGSAGAGGSGGESP